MNINSSRIRSFLALSLLAIAAGPAACTVDTEVSSSPEDVSSVSQATCEALSLDYGKYYYIQNGYLNWGGGFLDVRGAGCEGNLLCVSTATTPNRDGYSGLWRLMSADGKAEGTPVQPGDNVYLLNVYNGYGGALDVRGAGCESNLLCVSTATSPNLGIRTSTWTISPVVSSTNPLAEGQAVHLQNLYPHYPSSTAGGFLEVRGAGCESNFLCVSTHDAMDTVADTTHWRFVNAFPLPPAPGCEPPPPCGCE